MLKYFNSLGLQTIFTDLLGEKTPQLLSIQGWLAVSSFCLKANDGSLWDLDIRYAMTNECFKQHLFDHGWMEDLLLHPKTNDIPTQHKAILYYCDPEIQLIHHGWQQLSEVFTYGWKTIQHCYLSDSPNLPFETKSKVPWSSKRFPLGNFSTTRSLTMSSEDNIQSTKEEISSSENQMKGGLRVQNYLKPITTETPLISVITVVFNGAAYLEQTIQSVINQTYENVEYIIIDGRSTDNTVKIIQKYDDQIDYWISESDQGIYDAMNKGIKAARGKWLSFMNCGDLFNNENVLTKLKKYFIELQAPAMVGGEVLMFGEYKKFKKFRPLDFTLSNLINKGTAVVCHQAMLVTRSKVPLYDTTYRLKAELNWYYDLVKKEHFSWKIVDFVIAQYRLGGLGDISYVDFKELVLLNYRRAGMLASVRNIPQYIRYILVRIKKIVSLTISSQLQ